MIIVYAYRGKGKEKFTLAFQDGHMPRKGEYITLGRMYRITRVTHLFTFSPAVPNALQNQKYFANVPALEIELKEA
jgi:hypothetical protein